MKTTILFILTVAALGVFAADAGNDESDFMSIFDGKSMTGWVGNVDGYEAKEGILSCLPGKGKGGGWTGGDTSQFYAQAKYLASRGMVAICAQYRRSLKTAKPVWCVEDARSSMRFLRKGSSELGLDPNRIAAGGGSAGGHLAAATATISAFDCKDDDLSVSAVPNALVLFNPVFDNSPVGYGHDRLGKDYKRFSPIDNLDGKQPPTIVFLGDRDKHLPVASAKHYEKTMKAKGNLCKTCIYEGKGHGFFNLHKNGRDSFVVTMTETDQFLAGLGFLQGKPQVEAWLQAEEKK